MQHQNADKDSFPPVSRTDLTKAIGTQIGPYKVLSVLGEGGFGIVYLAEQKKPVRRQVALKVIKPGMDSKQVIARFEAEQQALALLDHPNIARVFDAGTTEQGRLYFAMEYVKGRSVIEYCDHEKLGIEDRLRLFIRICEAVQHAHQKGIIHRDIKPSNILVSIQAGQAVPKIIDFGVAKALGQPLTERTLFTEQGQLIGTPEYMSPEQAEVIDQYVDTRSDVYSLGVVLYELLSGSLPFDPKILRQAAFGEIQRIILEEDPPRPSARISTLGDSATEIAQNRRIDVKRLVKRLHNELEWIPLMAMRKEPDRRYGTASALAQDIRNYLNGAPLLAGPESTAYRFMKFVRRNRALVTGIAAVLVVLVAGITVSTSFAFWALRQHTLAEQRAADATAGLLPMDQLAGILRHQGRYDEAEQLYQTIRNMSLRLFTNEHPTAVLSMGCLASFYCERKRYEEAEALLNELIPLSRRIFGADDPNTLNYMGLLANLYSHTKRHDEALELYGDVMKISEAAFGKEDPYILVHTYNYAMLLMNQGQYDKAEPLFRQVVELSEHVLPEEHSYKRIYKNGLARLYVKQGRYDEADRLFSISAYNPDPADGAESVGPDNVTFTWTPGLGAQFHTVYLGTDYDEVDNATAGTPAGGTATYNPGPLEQEKIYYWRVDEFDGSVKHKGDIWGFTTRGAAATLQPANGAADVGHDQILTWTPATNANSHHLYFGTDREAVKNATTASPEYKGNKARGAESYDPGQLDWGASYYWRVDAVYGANTVNGLVWSFTTADFLVVDDFESYTNDDAAGQVIWQTWVDGFGIPDNGAQVGYLLPSYAEQTAVHSGAQSMPLLYINEAGVRNSEASLTLTALRDWTTQGVGELSLWFMGSSANAVEPLYVAISNAAGAPAIVANSDANAAKRGVWTVWVVPLQTFADQGINLTNVTKIAIGLGDKGGAAPGGSGTMFIDDIRLYRATP